MKRKAKAYQIPEWIPVYQSSGLSQKSFCRQEGIPYSQFQYQWRQYHRKGSPLVSSGFISLGIKEKSIDRSSLNSPHSLIIRLHLGEDRRLELEGSVSASFLRELAGW